MITQTITHPSRRSRGATTRVVLAAVALAAAAGLTGPTATQAAARSDGSVPASPAVIAAVAGVPATVLDGVGIGSVAPFGPKSIWNVKRLAGAPVAGGQKVNVLSINVAWCPHCAANSWPLAVALSRFGTLSGLRTIDTGTYYGKVLKAKPAHPHTLGLSFLRSTYVSDYLTFSPVVLQTRAGRLLQRPTKAEAKRQASFDREGQVPALAVGDVFGFRGAGYSPGALKGRSAGQIAAALADPGVSTTKAILGEANVLTAAICVTTGGNPAAVCTAPGVKASAARLPRRG